MSKTTTNYAQALGILVAAAVVVHYLGPLDWPWAIVAGAAVSVAARALMLLASALAAGILLDAIVIRGVLVPATVALIGRWNWWLPPRPARLLRVAPSRLSAPTSKTPVGTRPRI